jgi:hypothetical protein
MAGRLNTSHLYCVILEIAKVLTLIDLDTSGTHRAGDPSADSIGTAHRLVRPPTFPISPTTNTRNPSET